MGNGQNTLHVVKKRCLLCNELIDENHNDLQCAKQYYKMVRPMKKSNRGGNRKGAGRKKGNPTATVSIRHDKKIVNSVKKKFKGKLQEMGRAWLDGLNNWK